MTAPATALPAPLPIAWTTEELSAWLERLSAIERAELRWTRPELEAVYELLLEGALDSDRIETAVRRFTRVSLGCHRMLRRVVHGELPIDVLRQPLLDRLPVLGAFLGTPLATSQAHLAVQGVVAVLRTNQAGIGWMTQGLDPAELLAELEEADRDDLVEAILAGPTADAMRGCALLGALLETAERQAAVERGRELARLSMFAMARAVLALRGQGYAVPYAPEEPRTRAPGGRGGGRPDSSALRGRRRRG
jgi:hypothetical protein